MNSQSTHSVTLAHLRAMDFWSLVDMGRPEECWRLRSDKAMRYARVRIPAAITGSWAIVYSGSRAAKSLQLGRLIPRHLVVDHLCFNPPCVNPAHLDVVTQRTNLRRRRMVNHA